MLKYTLTSRDHTLYDLVIGEVTRQEVKDFIEANHYSHNINGVMSSHCFAVYHEGQLVAAAIFGLCAMAGQHKKYADNAADVIELRRFFAIDDTPRNFESFVLARMINQLRGKYKCIVSYSDPEYGHLGIIYKALGFTYMGQLPKQKVILVGDKRYHDKTIRTKYKGELKPFAQKIKNQLESGEARYITVQGKHRWIYPLN